MGISWVYNQLNMMWARLKRRRFYGKSSIDGGLIHGDMLISAEYFLFASKLGNFQSGNWGSTRGFQGLGVADFQTREKPDLW